MADVKNGFVRQAQFFITFLTLVAFVVAFAVTVGSDVTTNTEHISECKIEIKEQCQIHKKDVNDLKENITELLIEVREMAKDIEYIKNNIEKK